MDSNKLDQKEIELLENKYLVYLKEVPSKIAVGGITEKTTVRAFVKRI